ncbi:MAG: YnbE family lipoprotein [Pseudomonadota bacterium]
MNRTNELRVLLVVVTLGAVSGCTPTVRVEAPKEPIEINLNVKIEHEIRVQVDKELEGLFEEDSNLF